MKTLVLVRHGKSSWEYDVGDRDRPLKNRGVNDAKLVSETLNEIGFNPDIIISSPANRALSTCRIFMATFNWSDNDLRIVEDLYDFGGSSVVRYLQSLEDNFDSAIIFGHNHAFTSIANQFGTQYIDNLPTAGLVMIDFDIDSWKDIGSGKTIKMILPRDLK